MVSVLDRVTSLIDKSLLQQTEQEEEEPRFMMLETIRAYGLEMLAASGEMEAIQHAHATYYLALAEEAAPELRGPQQALWLERLEREYANLRAAMQWFLAQGRTEPGREMALRLGGALWDFWVVRGLYSEGRTFLEQALASSEGVATSVRARALSAAADFALFQSDVDRSEALRQESLVLYRELGDTRGSASSSWQLAWVASRRKGADFAAAQSLREESLSLYREVGDKACHRLVTPVHSGNRLHTRGVQQRTCTVRGESGDVQGTGQQARYLSPASRGWYCGSLLPRRIRRPFALG